MNDIAFILWWCGFVFVPLLLFLFKPQWKFLAIVLSCAFAVFFILLDITLVYNENLWGLLQTELEVSKNIFIIYKVIVIGLFLALLLIAYKNPRTRTIIFVFFVLCNVFMPFNIMENLLFGRWCEKQFLHSRRLECWVHWFMG